MKLLHLLKKSALAASLLMFLNLLLALLLIPSLVPSVRHFIEPARTSGIIFQINNWILYMIILTDLILFIWSNFLLFSKKDLTGEEKKEIKYDRFLVLIMLIFLGFLWSFNSVLMMPEAPGPSAGPQV